MNFFCYLIVCHKMHSKSELIRVLRVEFFIKFYQQCLGYFEKGGISHV